MSNLLYYCSLLDTVNLTSGEPREVLLRIYGPSYCDIEVQLEVFNQLAAEDLGPKLYGVFEGGRIEEFLPGSPLTSAELTNDDVSAVVAKKIAAIHKLNVESLDKEPNWLVDKINDYHDYIIKTKKEFPTFFGHNNISPSAKTIATELLAIDFRPEIELVANSIKESEAPLVFSHNDLHQNNILLLHDTDKDLYDRIVLIDFEYCSYNYRMFDLANHLSEQCFNYNTAEYPYFEASGEKFPSDHKQMQIVEHYVRQMHTVNGDENCNKKENGQVIYDNHRPEVETLFKEMQPNLMASNLLWCVWAIKSAYTSKINFGYWEMAWWKWQIYLLCKKRAFTGVGA